MDIFQVLFSVLIAGTSLLNAVRTKYSSVRKAWIIATMGWAFAALAEAKSFDFF